MEPTQSEDDKNPEITRLHCRIYRKLEALDNQASIEPYRERYGPGYSDDILFTSHLTGLHPQEVFNIKHTQDLKISLERLDRSSLLKELTDFYLNKEIMPTTRDMFDALQGKLPLYVDIASFRKQLALMDFMWKNIQGRFYVIERPEATYERYKFLKRVLEYHDNERPIFFVDKLPYCVRGGHTLVSCNCYPKNFINVLYAISKKVAVYKTVEEYNQESYKRFICNVLVPNLTENSLVVIKNKDYCCEENQASKPNIKSTKEDIKKWLNRNNVPYNDDTSKAELYLLVQTCKNTDQKTNFVDNIIMANGHNVVRIPNHIEQLTPTSCFFNLIQESFYKFSDSKTVSEARANIIQIFNTIDVPRLNQMYEGVLNEYKSLYQNDVKVDYVFDSLIAKMETLPMTPRAESTDIPTDEDEKLNTF